MTIAIQFTKEHDISVQKKITSGIKDYVQCLSIVEPDFFDLCSNTQKKTSTFMFDFFVKNRLLDNELKNSFFIDAGFNGLETLDVLEKLNSRGV